MNIVITMGGIGSRFRKAGYTVPKYEIEVNGKTLFDWSMLSLKSFFDEKFFFIVRKEDHARVFIQQHCTDLGIHASIHEIDYLTKGQAETAMLISDYWERDEGLFIYNIDTYVESGCMNAEQISGDGFIPCFTADGDHWSFVKLDKDGKAIEVREKERISNHCSLGAYYFSSAALYEKIYQEFYLNNHYLEKGEQYVAPMYNYMIEKGYEVRIQDIPAFKVHVLGTPEELEVFRK